MYKVLCTWALLCADHTRSGLSLVCFGLQSPGDAHFFLSPARPRPPPQKKFPGDKKGFVQMEWPLWPRLSKFLRFCGLSLPFSPSPQFSLFLASFAPSLYQAVVPCFLGVGGLGISHLAVEAM